MTLKQYGMWCIAAGTWLAFFGWGRPVECLLLSVVFLATTIFYIGTNGADNR